jgi:hypothetical protein
MDRFNLKSYNEKCGNTLSEQFKDVIEQRFNFTYWPYMRGNERVQDCIKQTFRDSYQNLLTLANTL